MKLTIILLTAGFLNVYAKGVSQNVSFSGKEVSLESVFQSIKQQTGFVFLYKEPILKSSKPVSISAENVPLEKFLSEIFKSQPSLKYNIKGKSIFISAKSPVAGSSDRQLNTSGTDVLSMVDPPIDVKGRVLNEKGEPVEGVTVTVRGTSRTTSTNANGEFRLAGLKNDAILVFTSVNMETFEVKIKGKTDLVISLKTKVTALDDVIVSMNTGYQTLPKERVTGSFAQPEKQMFNSRVATDVISKLQGITSGLAFNIDPATGQRNLVIRGRSTIFADAAPLVVVDNFPYEGDISNINPNDVEDITVLKDAAAASIWGVRASNGVIVITTKKGRLNRPLKVNLNTNVTIGKKPDLFYNPDFLSASDFIDVEKIFFNQGLYAADFVAGDPNDPFSNYPPISPAVEILNRQQNGQISAAEADAQINALRNVDMRNDLSEYFYRHSINQQYAINMSGGSNTASYYLSAGYDKNLAGQRGNEFERFTINSSLTLNPIKNLELGGSIYYAQATSAYDNTLTQTRTGGSQGKSIYPYAKLVGENGEALSFVKDYRYSFAESAESQGFQNWLFFPLQELRNKWNTTTARNYETRINISAKYTLLKELSAEVRYQYQRLPANIRGLAKGESYHSRNMVNNYATVVNGTPTGFNIPVGGILTTTDLSQSGNYIRGQLAYSRNFDKHALTAIAGIEQREMKTSTSSNILYGYNDETATHGLVDYFGFFELYPFQGFGSIPYGTNEQQKLDRFRSYYTNAAYTYNNKYTFSGSARADGSNFFGVKTNKKIVPLWSVGAKWDIDREKFYTLSWLPALKLRATYGYNGNLDKTVTAYMTARYQSFAYLIGGVLNGTISTPANPDLRWEKNRMFNIGVDFGFKDNIVTGSIEYFRKRGIDLMGDEILAPSVGYINPLTATNSLRGNFAQMKGHGVDVVLTSKNLDKAIKWTSNIVFSYATDKVTRFDAKNAPATLITYGNGNNSGFIVPMEGKPVFSIYSLRWGGLDPVNGDPRGYMADTLSNNYSALVNPTNINDIVYNGPGRPIVFGGFTNNFYWKGFSLSVNIGYKLGYYFRRTSISYYGLFNAWAGHKDFVSRWMKPGDEAITNVPSMPSDVSASVNRDNFYRLSEALVERGDHIRLQDISLSYSLDKRRWNKNPFNTIQFYIYTSNLGIIWRANNAGLDPDVYTDYPAPLSVALGCKVDF